MIKLFGITDKLFSSNGDKIIVPIKATVHKGDNEDFYLEMETGIEYIDDLTPNRILVAPTPQGEQAFRILNSENPIGYTRDISSCIICLIHRENDAVLMHIESYDIYIQLDNFVDIVSDYKNNPIKFVEIYKGKHTNLGCISIIKFFLHRLNAPYEVYDVFRNNSNETSVGYNYNTKEHYMARMNKGKPILTKRKLEDDL